MTENYKKKHSMRFLSIILSLCLLGGVLSAVANAAEISVLTSENVAVWPVADKEIYYGQKAKDEITLVGGLVTSDGTENGEVIAGSWEFTDADDYLPAAGNRNANIRFVPSNSDLYSGFEIKNTTLVKYKVNKPLPVLVDENNPPVATEVEAGAKLSTSILSGGQVKNPYNAEEPKALAGFWRWTKTTTVVNESGYYQARMVLANYEILYMDVWVQVASEIPETSIVEYPTVPELTYNPNVTWADIELTGGKAVIKETETEVEGTFAIKENRLTAIPNPNFTELEIVFTPANAEEALPYEFTIPVTVNALPISFGEDYKGTAIDEPFEVEVANGSKISGVLSAAKKHLNYPTPSVVMIEDANSLAENGKVYKVSVLNYNNSNYTGTYAYVKATFKTTEISSEIKSAIGSGLNKFFIDCGSYSPMGTFTVYCNGEEIAEVKRGVSFDCEVYTDEGGTYEITAKYNPVENDNFIVDDAFWSITVAPVRHIKVANTSSMPFTVNGNSGHTATIRTGDTIVMEYTMPEFAYWVIKDGNGKTVELDGVDVNEKKITFTMPDYDLKFSVKTPAQLEQEEAAANCDHICHSENSLLQMLWKLISMFCQLFNIQQYCDCGLTHYDAPLFGFIS